MQLERIEDSEIFWIDVVQGSVDEGEAIICVPLAALARETAIRLALSLHIELLIRGNDYLFTTTREATQALLLEERVLH